MAKPDYIHPDLLAMLPTYKLVADCYAGSEAVKGRTGFGSGGRGNGGGQVDLRLSPYLPDPSPASERYETRTKRYDDYIERAVFYNVTKRTINAMTGAVFSKYPSMVLGDLDVLEADADGAGKSLTQMSREAMTNCLKQGRGLLLADMPVNTDGVSKAAMSASGIRPVIAHYKSESVINWRYRKVGGVLKPCLIVLAETYTAQDDGYEAKTARQLLVLRLNDNDRAESEIFRKSDNSGEWVSQGINPMTDHNGKPLDYIPAYSYGAVNNDLHPDDVPMADLAHLNIAHFRNSADYEEACFLTAQPTLTVSGLTEQWVSDVLDNGVAIGSRSGILLPQGGSAQLLQMQSDGALFEAMSHKESQMVSIGAKLIQESSTAKTATEASADNADATSVLSSIANNVSDAFTKCIKACARYMGQDDKDLVFALNTQFDFVKLDPSAQAQMVANWQAGAITFSEMRAALVESEVGTIESHEEAEQIIKEEQGALIYSGRADE